MKKYQKELRKLYYAEINIDPKETLNYWKSYALWLEKLRIGSLNVENLNRMIRLENKIDKAVEILNIDQV